MITRAYSCGFLLIGLALSAPCDGFAQDTVEAPGLYEDASGTFAPAGPPTEMPNRVDAGSSCVVDLTRLYDLSGTLSGTFEIDYRILVQGPCEVPPVLGKYEEQWIAHGSFRGTLDGTAVAATLLYTARVEVGGAVVGDLVLADGAWGRLQVRGNLRGGHLSYAGKLAKEAPTGRQSSNRTGPR